MKKKQQNQLTKTNDLFYCNTTKTCLCNSKIVKLAPVTTLWERYAWPNLFQGGERPGLKAGKLIIARSHYRHVAMCGGIVQFKRQAGQDSAFQLERSKCSDTLPFHLYGTFPHYWGLHQTLIKDSSKSCYRVCLLEVAPAESQAAQTVQLDPPPPCFLLPYKLGVL